MNETVFITNTMALFMFILAIGVKVIKYFVIYGCLKPIKHFDNVRISKIQTIIFTILICCDTFYLIILFFYNYNLTKLHFFG